MNWVSLIVLAVAAGLIPATIAWKRGRDFFLWWFYGSLLFLIATPHAILLTPNRGMLDLRKSREGYGRCPECAEMVRKTARRCRYCAEVLVEEG